MKKCTNCGAELPDEALFCPYCVTSQNEAKEARTPKIWRKRTAIVLIAVLAIVAAAVTYRLALGPRTYDANGPELTYKGYHVLLSLSGGPEPHQAQEFKEVTAAAHASEALPSQIFVYRDNDTVNAQDEFMALVETAVIRTEPRDGANQMEHTDPYHDKSIPNAALLADVVYDPSCGTNDIVWNITMKNGDRLILRQYIATHLLPEAYYYSEDYDMSTIESLQALLDEIEATVDPETHVSIYLPPVIYEGGLTMSDRTYFLYGSTDGSAMTTFRGGINVETDAPAAAEIYNIRFMGDGGTGLRAGRYVLLRGCDFVGWDVGAQAVDGGWLSVHDCTFESCGIGIQFQTSNSRGRSELFEDVTFADCGIGFQAAKLPEDLPYLAFPGCVFRDNETDLKNDTDAELDTSEATIE